ncbi:MAG: type II secretion system GspH family protein [Endomicrobia bacterium]|nr:type II secretion system GspH family protein [Endomicrobiia bacterium]MCL2506722.1 type II secretion system GspH family protein [Endomicrobiia bacterium]
MNKKDDGFSAIEIVIAVAVIILLAIIAVPKMADTLKKSNENATKASLGSLRSAIAMYYGDHEGNYPDANIAEELTKDAKYIASIPAASGSSYHPKSNKIVISGTEISNDTGEWIYKADDTEDENGRVKGQIWINCTHKDSKGNVWNEL